MRMIRGLLARRRALVAVSIAAYVALVFVGLARAEVPGLGLGHLLYVPIVLLALAGGPLWGALAGAAGSGVYLLGASLNPHFAPNVESLSIATVIRFVSFAGIGLLVGSASSHNRDLMQRLKEHAERDFLTDLLNARAFESELTTRIAREQPFALVLADVDGLKLVNDSEGHAAGNDYLRRLASALREATAPQDTVARIGGDEFIVLTDLRPGLEAEETCRGLHDALTRRGISVSFGYAVYPDEGADQLALFHAADKRLYESKFAGASRRLRSVS
jgi:diguanylate cyclase (GGDEF)-like protein